MSTAVTTHFLFVPDKALFPAKKRHILTGKIEIKTTDRTKEFWAMRVFYSLLAVWLSSYSQITLLKFPDYRHI